MRNLSWNQWITECNNNINSAEVWRIITAAKGTAPIALTHHRPQEEADSLCDSFAQQCSEDTINKLTQMVPARVRTITTDSYEAVNTDQDVLYRLKDSAPLFAIQWIKNALLATRHLLLLLSTHSYDPC